jgi:hypothetical protein
MCLFWSLICCLTGGFLYHRILIPISQKTIFGTLGLHYFPCCLFQRNYPFSNLHERCKGENIFHYVCLCRSCQCPIWMCDVHILSQWNFCRLSPSFLLLDVDTKPWAAIRIFFLFFPILANYRCRSIRKVRGRFQSSLVLPQCICLALLP